MTDKFGRLALHMWTIDTTPLATALDAARQGGFDAVELRRTDFKRCYEAGMSLADALRGLAARAGVSALSTLVSALIQTERLGTQIADTLRVQSEAMRVRRLQLAEEIAQKAPVKMLFPAAILIFPALLIMILYPAVVGIIDTFGN
jgi:sugar phosphate isomerase/epimerase